MKKLAILLAITTIGLMACKKTEVVKPAQLVSYDVEGKYILVYVKDNVWQGQYQQHFVVQGKWHYEFENTKLDTAFLSVYHGTFTPNQRVKATIKVNGKVVQTIDKYYTEWGSMDTIQHKLR